MLVLAALFATGCMKLIYNRLDTLAGWYVRDLVSLEDSQRAQLQAWLKETLAWHRGSELERYAQFLRQLSAQVAQPGSRSSYADTERRMESFGDDLVARGSPEAARLLLSLSPAQVDELLENLAEKGREYEEKSQQRLAAGKWHKHRAKEMQEELKRWTGAVSPEQKQLVQEWSLQLQPAYAEWGESQRQWRTALRDALQGSAPPQQAQARVEQLLRDADHEWTPQYVSKAEHNREQTFALLEALDAGLSPSQRAHLQRELIELAEQLEALMED